MNALELFWLTELPENMQPNSLGSDSPIVDADKQCEDTKIWQVVLMGLGHGEGYLAWSWEERESKKASLSHTQGKWEAGLGLWRDG